MSLIALGIVVRSDCGGWQLSIISRLLLLLESRTISLNVLNLSWASWVDFPWPAA